MAQREDVDAAAALRLHPHRIHHASNTKLSEPNVVHGAQLLINENRSGGAFELGRQCHRGTCPSGRYAVLM